ncbi:hypothetical protein RBB77_14210 [Tunturibacter psychrotolerans]|uniref:Tyr recombinase domain-containing protein n=1 Tax=Tunturiibacter psychrotolerans TaxID=3069686 RepID=A0AAU7ZK65_9BACT
MFSPIRVLPSPTFARRFPPLFGWFTGTTAQSDFSSTCMSAVQFMAILHDLRRTAALNLRRAGISETVIMKIGDWRTRSVLERYAIVSRGDIVDAMQELQINQQESQIRHEIGYAAQANHIDTAPKSIN